MKKFEIFSERFNKMLEFKYVLTKTREILGENEYFDAINVADKVDGEK